MQSVIHPPVIRVIMFSLLKLLQWGIDPIMWSVGSLVNNFDCIYTQTKLKSTCFPNAPHIKPKTEVGSSSNMNDVDIARHMPQVFSICYILTEKADDIPGHVIHEIVIAEPPYVLIKWNAPRSPNGLIILYEVFYRKVGDTEVSINHLWASIVVKVMIIFQRYRDGGQQWGR